MIVPLLKEELISWKLEGYCFALLRGLGTSDDGEKMHVLLTPFKSLSTAHVFHRSYYSADPSASIIELEYLYDLEDCTVSFFLEAFREETPAENISRN